MTNRDEISKDVDDLLAGWFDGERHDVDRNDIVELVLKHSAGAVLSDAVLVERVGRVIAKADPELRGQFDDSEMGDYFWEKWAHAYRPQAEAAIVEINRAPPPTHRHKKLGTEYTLLGVGKMQADTWKVPHTYRDMGETETDMVTVDMREVAIYRSIDDGSLWVRPREEFEDGRFEPLTSLLPTVWIMRTVDGGFYPIQPSDKCTPEDHGKLNGHVVAIEDLAGEVLWRREENAK